MNENDLLCDYYSEYEIFMFLKGKFMPYYEKQSQIFSISEKFKDLCFGPHSIDDCLPLT
jgi:hypothetical protein